MTVHLHIEVATPESATEADRFNLMAAEGWLELGNWREALAELDQVAPEHQMTPVALALRYQCLAAAEKWEEAIALARGVQKVLPGTIVGIYYLAQALHNSGRTLEAYAAIRRVLDEFPGEWLLRFALARYCCRLCRKAEALCWIEEAIEMGDKDDIQQLARGERDLDPIRREIEKM